MANLGGKESTHFEPAPGWTLLTDSPLKGLALAREAGLVLTWDAGDVVSLHDASACLLHTRRVPGRIMAASISDDGTLVVLLVEGPRLCWLDASLETLSDRSAPPDPLALAMDPHGRYIALTTKLGTNYLYNRHGRPAGSFEARMTLAHILFVPDKPLLIAAASFGSIVGFELRPIGTTGKLACEMAWDEAVLSNIGRMTTSGDGGMVLASCFSHGIQRFDLEGRNEGSYQLGGTVAHAVPDFPGRLIAASTLESELVLLTPGGHIRWRKTLPRPVVALEVDALGRSLIYGHGTGEVVQFVLDPSLIRRPPAGPERPHRKGAAATSVTSATATPSIRQPAWSVPVVGSDEHAETAVLTVLDDPLRIGVLSSGNRLQVYDETGRFAGSAPEIMGIGRILRTSPGWIAAATDRQVALVDARRNLGGRLDVSLVEVTHLAIRPDSYGLAIVQERDRVGRVTPAGRWIWKKELRNAVEDLSISRTGETALTTDAGRLEVFGPSGEPIHPDDTNYGEPLSLIDAPEASATDVVWVTLARRAQVLRGHDLQGRVVWQTGVPWEGWQIQRLGQFALITAPDGRVLAFDGSGTLHAEGRGLEHGVDVFGVADHPDATPWRVNRSDIHLISSDLSGASAGGTSPITPSVRLPPDPGASPHSSAATWPGFLTIRTFQKGLDGHTKRY